MALWSFRCYLSPAGKDEIRATYDHKQRQARNNFLSRLKTLAVLPFEEWHDGLYKNLHGVAAGVAEIRFKADRVPQRVLCFRSGPSEVSLLIWATEKNDKFVPLSAPDTALTRKAEILENKDRTDALWLALE